MRRRRQRFRQVDAAADDRRPGLAAAVIFHGAATRLQIVAQRVTQCVVVADRGYRLRTEMVIIYETPAETRDSPWIREASLALSLPCSLSPCRCRMHTSRLHDIR